MTLYLMALHDHYAAVSARLGGGFRYRGDLATPLVADRPPAKKPAPRRSRAYQFFPITDKPILHRTKGVSVPLFKQGEEIIREVARKHHLTIAEIRSHQRTRKLTEARNEAFYRLRTETTWAGKPLPLNRIGKAFGRDHSTVISALKQYAKNHPAGGQLQ